MKIETYKAGETILYTPCYESALECKVLLVMSNSRTIAVQFADGSKKSVFAGNCSKIS